MSLNSHQKAYAEDMARTPSHLRCWCGWFLLSECRCERNGAGVATLADRIEAECPECHNAPFQQGGEIVHSVKCSKS